MFINPYYVFMHVLNIYRTYMYRNLNCIVNWYLTRRIILYYYETIRRMNINIQEQHIKNRKNNYEKQFSTEHTDITK